MHLLQLASPALPVGAYSYSEGLETLVETGIVTNQPSLRLWLEQQLKCGAITVEAAVMLRATKSCQKEDLASLNRWNDWLSAARETQELRQQSWQMGRSLAKLLVNLQPELTSVVSTVGIPCNYAIAFGIAAAYWQIDAEFTVIAYVQSWLANLIGAGVKLIPLGQTEGQKLLFALHPLVQQTSQRILTMEDRDLNSCSWGLALASMAHEEQYTRLFRS